MLSAVSVRVQEGPLSLHCCSAYVLCSFLPSCGNFYPLIQENCFWKSPSDTTINNKLARVLCAVGAYINSFVYIFRGKKWLFVLGWVLKHGLEQRLSRKHLWNLCTVLPSLELLDLVTDYFFASPSLCWMSKQMTVFLSRTSEMYEKSRRKEERKKNRWALWNS